MAEAIHLKLIEIIEENRLMSDEGQSALGREFSFLHEPSLLDANPPDVSACLDSTLNISNINDVSSVGGQKRRATVKVVQSRYMAARPTAAPSSRETIAPVPTDKKDSTKPRTTTSTRLHKEPRAPSTGREPSAPSSRATFSAATAPASLKPPTSAKTPASSSARKASGTATTTQSATKKLIDTTASGSSSSKTRVSSTRSTTSTATAATSTTSHRLAPKSTGTTSTRVRVAGPGSSSASAGASSGDATSDAKRQASRQAKLEKRLQAWNQDLDILHSIHLQWLFINARANHASAKQRAEAEQQLYAATQTVAKLRQEVAHEQALLERDKYNAHLEEVVNAQYSCMSLLEDGINKMAPAYGELAAAVEATTHRLPTTDIIVPPAAELAQVLRDAEDTMSGILEGVGPQLEALGEYARSTEGLVAVLGEELKGLKTTKELLVQTDMLESERRSLFIQYIHEHGRRPDE